MTELEQDALSKTTRVNLLFDFYGSLLTEKQRTFLTYYFQDDYSLGEIAEQFSVSRQAIFEHIKRAEMMLEEYEAKLQLLDKHMRRKQLAERVMSELEKPLVQSKLGQVRKLLDEMVTGI